MHTDYSYTNAVIFLANCRKTRVTDDLLISVAGYTALKTISLQMPKYAIDMHTIRGRSRGMGFPEFVEEGTRLNNETLDNIYKDMAAKILLNYGSPFDKK